MISFERRQIYVGKGLRGCYISVRSTTTDRKVSVFYCRQKLITVDLDACIKK